MKIELISLESLDVLYAGLRGEVDDCAEEEPVHEELHDAVGVPRHQQRRRRDPLPADKKGSFLIPFG